MAKKNLDTSSGISLEYNRNYFYLACYYSVINRVTEAIDNLEIAVEKGFKEKEWMQKEKSLKSIQRDTRFKELLDSM